jgi:hypothetical protein
MTSERVKHDELDPHVEGLPNPSDHWDLNMVSNLPMRVVSITSGDKWPNQPHNDRSRSPGEPPFIDLPLNTHPHDETCAPAFAVLKLPTKPKQHLLRLYILKGLPEFFPS